MKATYNVTGDERKALVRIISEVIGMKPVYMRMPTCAYVIAGITVEKDGAVVWDERTDDTTIEAVKAALSDAGFTAEEDTRPEVASNEYGLVVQMPKASFTEDSLDNLHRLIEAKGSLIKKALDVTELPITEEDDKLSFPWFTTETDPDEVRAYTHFLRPCARWQGTRNVLPPRKRKPTMTNTHSGAFCSASVLSARITKRSAKSCSAIFPAAPHSVTAHRQRRCQYASDFKRTPAGTA